MIRDHRETGAVEGLYREHFETPTWRANSNGQKPPVSASERTDAEVIEKARAEKGGKFDRLWNGDTSDYGYDHSDADDGFVHKLWPYTQDEEQIRRIHAASSLHRPEKSGKRADYLQRSIVRAREHTDWFYEWDPPTLSLNGNGMPPSQRPVPIGDRTMGRKLEVVRLGEVEQPGPRRYVVEDLVPAGYPTLWHGDGGVAKSMIALSLGVGVAGGAESWLGRAVEHAPVLYLDFELEAEEQARRVWQLCRGAGLKEPPAKLFYVSAVGHATRDALRAALQACQEHHIKLLVVDSLGPALQGDAEAARDVIGFYRTCLDPFRALGVATLIIDHQARLQAGESYQRKGAFGSVYKANLARSVIQAEATERAEGTLSLRIRQKKHNFGPLASPFGVRLAFSEEAVSMETVELDPAQLAEEATLTAPERIKLALQDGPLYPSEIAETTGVSIKTVKNSLTGLRKQGAVEPTGEKEGREEQIRIVVPASLSLKGDGTRADDERPLSDALVPGQSAMLSDLADYKAAGAQMRRSKSGPALALGTYLERPDDERLKWLTKAVLTALGKDTSDWEVYASAVKAAAEDPRNHPPDCECGECA